jgi:hypothetical protein
MTWAELQGSDWTLPAARNKTGVDLVRPLSRAAQAILDRLPKAGEFVWSTNGGAVPISGFTQFKRKFDKASVAADLVIVQREKERKSRHD